MAGQSHAQWPDSPCAGQDRQGRRRWDIGRHHRSGQPTIGDPGWKAVVESLNDYHADRFVTSRHAAGRPWQIDPRRSNVCAIRQASTESRSPRSGCGETSQPGNGPPGGQKTPAKMRSAGPSNCQHCRSDPWTPGTVDGVHGPGHGLPVVDCGVRPRSNGQGHTSSACRTFSARVWTEKGFWRKCTPGSSTPWCAITLAV